MPRASHRSQAPAHPVVSAAHQEPRKIRPLSKLARETAVAQTLFLIPPTLKTSQGVYMVTGFTARHRHAIAAIAHQVLKASRAVCENYQSGLGSRRRNSVGQGLCSAERKDGLNGNVGNLLPWNNWTGGCLWFHSIPGVFVRDLPSAGKTQKCCHWSLSHPRHRLHSAVPQRRMRISETSCDHG